MSDRRLRFGDTDDALDKSLSTLQDFGRRRGIGLGQEESSTRDSDDVLHLINVSRRGRRRRGPEWLSDRTLRTPSSHGLPNRAGLGAVATGGMLPPFEIPTLPRGRLLRLDILSTWGDTHYVGLHGVEVFDGSGHPIRISKASIAAEPADINDLEEYADDPRTVDKLVDGVNHTRSDMHAWLAPFTAGQHHYVFILLPREMDLAMVRVWNYNKNRIHSHRGARYVEISLDEHFIFKGEIKQAPGSAASPERCSETILFTEDPTVLALMERLDPVYADAMSTSTPVLSVTPGGSRSGRVPGDRTEVARPKTAGRDRPQWGPMPTLEPPTSEPTTSGSPSSTASRSGARPGTGAMRRRPAVSPAPTVAGVRWPESPRSHGRIRPASAPAHGQWPVPVKGGGVEGQVLEIAVLDNWGDPYAVGLSGLCLMGAGGTRIDVPPAACRATSPLDLSPYAPPARCLLEPFRTADADCMWAVPVTEPGTLVLSIDLGRREHIAALCIYNYNDGLEGSFCGVRSAAVFVDGAPAIPTGGATLVRKAPGSAAFDFGQIVPLGWPQRPQDSSAGAMGRGSPPRHGFARAVSGLDAVVDSDEDDEAGSETSRGQADSVPASPVLASRLSPSRGGDALHDAADVAHGSPVLPPRPTGARRRREAGSAPVRRSPVAGAGLRAGHRALPARRPVLRGVHAGGRHAGGAVRARPEAGMAVLGVAVGAGPRAAPARRGARQDRRWARGGETAETGAVSGGSVGSSGESDVEDGEGDGAVWEAVQGVGASAGPVASANGAEDAPFARGPATVTAVEQQYETPVLPQGCIVRVAILSAWGDRFFVGLNGIELMDSHHRAIPVAPGNVHADPPDVNVLPGFPGDDPRVVGNLVDGVNDTADDAHMWLAPLSSDGPNHLFLTFDEPVAVSAVRVWNYSKTPERGARTVQIFMDDSLIYSGDLRQAPLCASPDDVPLGGFRETILFTNHPAVVRAEADRVHLPAATEAGILFIDDGARLREETPEPRPATRATRRRRVSAEEARSDAATTGRGALPRARANETSAPGR